ncbi:unnamed protein product [Parascedosporium putredinis]|uniref:Uncharacterized protein n=1 Tax=Parascedosporium putredinis TaxID=1442378 RepID=A0A9P1H619_9PEZI|nr:unnamed protein product [Parascedosporium putredinis]CAI7996973.1 unnamed protein product [Parascedosporium putredinis]
MLKEQPPVGGGFVRDDAFDSTKKRRIDTTFETHPSPAAKRARLEQMEVQQPRVKNEESDQVAKTILQQRKPKRPYASFLENYVNPDPSPNLLKRLFLSGLSLWKQNELDYYMANVDSFLLQKPEDYIQFHNYTRNIIDWEKDKRLNEIRRSLDSLLEETRQRTSEVAKSRPPPSDGSATSSGKAQVLIVAQREQS